MTSVLCLLLTPVIIYYASLAESRLAVDAFVNPVLVTPISFKRNVVHTARKAQTTTGPGFHAVSSRSRHTTAYASSSSSSSNRNDKEDDKNEGEKEKWSRGSGPNWIEKCSPTGIKTKVDLSSNDKNTDNNNDGVKIDYYTLGISGKSFETASLSRRMYETLLSAASTRFPNGVRSIPDELLDIYRQYAIDFTAREAVKAALKQNGLQLVVDDDDMGMWCDVTSVTLHDPITNKVDDEESFDTFREAVEEGDWQPGQGFDFVVTSVPAKLKEMDIADLLKALDPTGELRREAKEKGMTMPDEELMTLQDLANDNVRRSNVAPREAVDEDEAFWGEDDVRGYTAIKRGDLSRDSVNLDGTENRGTLMHVMDALVSHSALIVDLTDGGATYREALAISKMWQTTERFFDTLQTNPSAAEKLPSMQVAAGAGSKNAMIGYASYDDGSMQFLETRLRRSDGALLPENTQDIIGREGCLAMKDAFDVINNVGKDVVRIATAAASVETNAFVVRQSLKEEDESMPFISGLTDEDVSISGLSWGDGDVVDNNEDDEVVSPTKEELAAAGVRASEAAALLVDELMDDGKPLQSTGVLHEGGAVNMSPHRMCRYTDNKARTQTKETSGSPREVFGAHTDTSFVTIVPCAAVSGLEVYDEAAERWYRPELMARRHWESERIMDNLDPMAMTETIRTGDDEDEKEEIPWHARYLVVMPGELLQLVSSNEVPACVHRVVAMKEEDGGKVRFSAPVLLRARPGIKLDVTRYFGNTNKAGPLLTSANGMKMEEIHDAMQPSSFQ